MTYLNALLEFLFTVNDFRRYLYNLIL